MRKLPRLVLPLAFTLLLGTLPGASAAPAATVTLSGPASVDVPGHATVPITIDLTLADFHCFHDQEFHVGLTLNATGVRAAMDSYVATFTVPEGSYAFEPWSGETSLNVQLDTMEPGPGQVDVLATFVSDGGNCLAPGGFPETSATLSITTSATAATTPPPEPTPPTETPTDPTTPTSPSSPTEPTSATPPAGATNATPTSVDQLPPGGGYIGDYQASANSTPGPALGVVVAGGAAAAIFMRRRA